MTIDEFHQLMHDEKDGLLDAFMAALQRCTDAIKQVDGGRDGALYGASVPGLQIIIRDSFLRLANDLGKTFAELMPHAPLPESDRPPSLN